MLLDTKKVTKTSQMKRDNKINEKRDKTLRF